MIFLIIGSVLCCFLCEALFDSPFNIVVILLLLALTRTTDIISTVLMLKKTNSDYAREENPLSRWLLFKINLPNTIVLLISEMIILSTVASVLGLFWMCGMPQICIKILVFCWIFLSADASVHNFTLYFLKDF